MKIKLSKSQWEETGKKAGWTRTAQSVNNISIPVATLQWWALALSQGDNAPRWEIEKILEQNNQPTRDPKG